MFGKLFKSVSGGSPEPAIRMSDTVLAGPISVKFGGGRAVHAQSFGEELYKILVRAAAGSGTLSISAASPAEAEKYFSVTSWDPDTRTLEVQVK